MNTLVARMIQSKQIGLIHSSKIVDQLFGFRTYTVTLCWAQLVLNGWLSLDGHATQLCNQPPGQLSLLLSAGLATSTGQSASMHRGWEVKTGWLLAHSIHGRTCGWQVKLCDPWALEMSITLIICCYTNVLLTLLNNSHVNEDDICLYTYYCMLRNETLHKWCGAA